MAKKNSTVKKAGKPVKISRVNPDNIRSVPVNDVLISHTRHEFYITFSSVEPPPILDEKDFEKLERIEAFARAKLVVAPKFIEALIKALTTNMDRYKEEESSETNGTAA
jgi:hypothetical protein